MAQVYLDASFVSACVTDRTDAHSIHRRETSLEWWGTQRPLHELFISQEVLDELSDPAFRRGTEALKFVANLPLFEIDEEVRGLARLLVRERVMPAPAVGDAVHVAACAVHGCAYLLSWNVRHMANPNKLAHMQVICRRVGVAPPTILTPDLLWES